MGQVAPIVDIVVVEPDNELLGSMEATLRSAGYSVFATADGSRLLDVVRACAPSCIILDLGLTASIALDLVKHLSGLTCATPVIVMSSKPSVAIIVEAMRNGASNFIEKPVDPSVLLMCIQHSISTVPERAEVSLNKLLSETKPGQKLLTEREREVLKELAGGASSKEAGRRLGISPRTVDVHRARIKEKLKAKRAVDLVRMVYDAGGDADPPKSREVMSVQR